MTVHENMSKKEYAENIREAVETGTNGDWQDAVNEAMYFLLKYDVDKEKDKEEGFDRTVIVEQDIEKPTATLAQTGTTKEPVPGIDVATPSATSVQGPASVQAQAQKDAKK